MKRLLKCYSTVVKSYSDTLCLPSTTFPLRPDHSRQYELQHRNTQTLYDWQLARPTALEDFVLQDGPPYANGDLHIGHALNKIAKDIIVRRTVLDGRRVRYQPGWDCHGLPIELKALEKYGEEHNCVNRSQDSIRRIARTLAIHAVAKQSEQFQKMAVIADWAAPYLTLDTTYEIAQLQVFAKMIALGLIYRAKKPVYWSPSSKTALAEAELEYREDHVSHSVYVGYPLSAESTNRLLKDLPGEIETIELVIWTTTPWTIPANRAIAVGTDLKYSLLRTDTKAYIIASSLISKLSKFFGPDAILLKTTIHGSELQGMTYKDCLQDDHSTRPVLCAEHVSADSGTGLVHTAPGHGQEDYMLCKNLEKPIAPFSPVDDAGRYTSEVENHRLVGLDVQTTGSKKVVQMLEDRGYLIATEKYKHKYPYDWRTKKPVIMRATPQFFTSLGSIKSAALTSLAKVSFMPESGRARLESFVKSRDEWCISRQRAWGVPIPALYSDVNHELLLTQESIMHIMNVLKERGTDAWFEEDQSPDGWKDWVVPELRNGPAWKRGRETLDVWFDSGCAWTTLGSDHVMNDITADLYLEGTDQHRGWFQSSLLTSIAVRSTAPYKKVVTHGFVLDSHGRKMSKSIGNVIEPILLIEGKQSSPIAPVPQDVSDVKERKRLQRIAEESAKEVKPLGVDALRLWVAQSDYTSDISVSPAILAHVAESLRKIRTTIRYILGNIQDYDVKRDGDTVELLEIDRFAVWKSTQFRQRAEVLFADYTFNKVVALVNTHTNTFLSAFYFDSLKDRLYADKPTGPSRRSAQSGLVHILKDYLVVLAPICPLLVTETWDHIPSSIFMSDKPEHIYASDWARRSTDQTQALTDGEQREWEKLMMLKAEVNKFLEGVRKKKQITTSLQADLHISGLSDSTVDLAGLLLVSNVTKQKRPNAALTSHVIALGREGIVVEVYKAAGKKCPRCWIYTAESDEHVCGRCSAVLANQ